MSIDCEVSVASVGDVVRFPSHGSTTHDARTPSAKKSRWGKSDDELHNFNNILIWLNNKGQLIFYKIKLKSTVYSKMKRVIVIGLLQGFNFALQYRFLCEGQKFLGESGSQRNIHMLL